MEVVAFLKGLLYDVGVSSLCVGKGPRYEREGLFWTRTAPSPTPDASTWTGVDTHASKYTRDESWQSFSLVILERSLMGW